MKKKKAPNPKRKMQMAIIAGAIIIGGVIILNYNLDQAKISGQSFGEGLAQIQNDLKNETADYDAKISLYQNGNITKQDILQISDTHIAVLSDMLSKYNKIKPPGPFAPSLELFRLSTQAQLDSDKLLKEWIQTGDNSTKIRSDQLLEQSFYYETRALDSFNKAKTNSE
ncbi:hypothetical protein HY212_06015 [Candidatus Pacearchaeota archaeon]|nr:hypothetical protein [Candidatus Pacearchaeota archaeon]